MDVSKLNSLANLNSYNNGAASIKNSNGNTSFEDLFQSALSMVKNTNDLTNAAEKEEINYSLGLTDDSLALQTAQTKASISLQYTVAVRNKILEAYKEIMNLQF